VARKRRAIAHGRERAAWRRERAALQRLVDPDDHGGDLCWIARADLREMVHERRSADKTVPLLQWARARVAAREFLREQDTAGVLAHFRTVLPDGLVGEHARSHLAAGLRVWPDWWGPATRPTRELQTRQELHVIIAAGLHGALNARLRAELTVVRSARVWRVIDGKPQLVRGTRQVPPRLLAGKHGIDAFARQPNRATRRIVNDVARAASRSAR
jgi:hypothetical protein